MMNPKAQANCAPTSDVDTNMVTQRSLVADTEQDLERDLLQDLESNLERLTEQDTDKETQVVDIRFKDIMAP
jgi:hypothetical protein